MRWSQKLFAGNESTNDNSEAAERFALRVLGNMQPFRQKAGARKEKRIIASVGKLALYHQH